MSLGLILGSPEFLNSYSLSSSLLYFSPISMLLTDVLLCNLLPVHNNASGITTEGCHTSDINLVFEFKL
jgi:hypothetical protein